MSHLVIDLLRALSGDGLGPSFSSFGVQVVGGLGGLQVVVQFVHQGDTGGDVQPGDVGVGDVVQLLDQRSQRVTVGADQHGLARQQVGGNVVLPVGQQSVDDDLQRLGLGDDLGVQVGVSSFAVLRVLVVRGDRRRRHVERASVGLELFGTVFLHRLRLVSALQVTVVTFVESPRALDGQPRLAGFVEGNVGGLDGTCQQRGVDDVELEVGLLDQFPGSLGFLLALFSQRDVDPTSELVGGVPFRLTVT